MPAQPQVGKALFQGRQKCCTDGLVMPIGHKVTPMALAKIFKNRNERIKIIGAVHDRGKSLYQLLALLFMSTFLNIGRSDGSSVKRRSSNSVAARSAIGTT